jgi:hypothetical protein
MGNLPRTLDQLFNAFSTAEDVLVSWRLCLSIVLALAVVWIAREAGGPLTRDAYIVAAVVGLVVGLGWELMAAAARRGYS